MNMQTDSVEMNSHSPSRRSQSILKDVQAKERSKRPVEQISRPASDQAIEVAPGQVISNATPFRGSRKTSSASTSDAKSPLSTNDEKEPLVDPRRFQPADATKLGELRSDAIQRNQKEVKLRGNTEKGRGSVKDRPTDRSSTFGTERVRSSTFGTNREYTSNGKRELRGTENRLQSAYHGAGNIHRSDNQRQMPYYAPYGVTPEVQYGHQTTHMAYDYSQSARPAQLESARYRQDSSTDVAYCSSSYTPAASNPHQRQGRHSSTSHTSQDIEFDNALNPDPRTPVPSPYHPEPYNIAPSRNIVNNQPMAQNFQHDYYSTPTPFVPDPYRDHRPRDARAPSLSQHPHQSNNYAPQYYSHPHNHSYQTPSYAPSWPTPYNRPTLPPTPPQPYPFPAPHLSDRGMYTPPLSSPIRDEHLRRGLESSPPAMAFDGQSHLHAARGVFSPCYTCPEQGCANETPFQGSAELKRHIETVHNLKLIDCEHERCDRYGGNGFTSESRYRVHLREDHPKGI